MPNSNDLGAVRVARLLLVGLVAVVSAACSESSEPATQEELISKDLAQLLPDVFAQLEASRTVEYCRLFEESPESSYRSFNSDMSAAPMRDVLLDDYTDFVREYCSR